MFINKSTVLSGVCIFSLVPAMCLGVGIDFIDNSFDDFVNRVITDAKERELFKRYYAELQTKITSFDAEKSKNLKRYLYQVGLQGLKVDRPKWYASIKPFVSDPRLTLDQDLNKIREVVAGFLNRYGAYQEFSSRAQRAGEHQGEQIVHLSEKNDETQSKGVLRRITTSLAQLGNKVVGWFGVQTNETA